MNFIEKKISFSSSKRLWSKLNPIFEHPMVIFYAFFALVSPKKCAVKSRKPLMPNTHKFVSIDLLDIWKDFFSFRSKRFVRKWSNSWHVKSVAANCVMSSPNCNENESFSNKSFFIVRFRRFRIPNSIGSEIEKACRGIYPLSNVNVRKVKVLKKPKFDSKFDWKEKQNKRW